MSQSNLFGYQSGMKPITEQQIAQFMKERGIQASRKMSREEIMQMMRTKNQGKLLYTDFQKIILDF
tara:strand:+ start:449 stop:646 length:198 start_codon:yes stop_codon:yes gene_type:complete